jgi:hypothetical protein
VGTRKTQTSVKELQESFMDEVGDIVKESKLKRMFLMEKILNLRQNPAPEVAMERFLKGL